MATLKGIPHPAHKRYFEKVSAAAISWRDRVSNFDSLLTIPSDLTQNWTLTVNLRVFLAKINPDQNFAPMFNGIARQLGLVFAGDAGKYADYDRNFSWIKEWSNAEWTNFTNGVIAQANLWNGRFWLIPPDNSTLFNRTLDVWSSAGSLTFRPNIKCLFNYQITPTHLNSHTRVNAVNILGREFFRTDNANYSNRDINARRVSKPDWRSQIVRTLHPVVAHEVGHSLGLPHVGLTRNLAPCSFALTAAQLFRQDALPMIFRGANGADVCYGTRSTAGDIRNIMGSGDLFEPENGKPWLDRLFSHLNFTPTELAIANTHKHLWKVSMVDVPPRKVV